MIIEYIKLLNFMNEYFRAKRIDSGEYVVGFFTKKKIGSLIVPVIEVVKEWDGGDYIETYEIDGNTLVSNVIKQRNVAVISLDLQDFEEWKYENSSKHDKLDTQRRFNVDNTTYHCVSKVCDLCSHTLDEIIETKHAIENKEYGYIKSLACACLVTNKGCK